MALCEAPRVRAAPAVKAVELSVEHVLKELVDSALDA